MHTGYFKLQSFYFICYCLNGFVFGINFDCIKLKVHRNSCNAFFNYICSTALCRNIGIKTFSQCVFAGYKRNIFYYALFRIQIIYNRINDGLFVHYPTENNIFISRAMNKIVKKVTNIVSYHCFGFIRYLKRVRIPAPVTVKKYASWQIFLSCWLTAVLPTPIVPLIK